MTVFAQISYVPRNAVAKKKPNPKTNRVGTIGLSIFETSSPEGVLRAALRYMYMGRLMMRQVLSLIWNSMNSTRKSSSLLLVD